MKSPSIWRAVLWHLNDADMEGQASQRVATVHVPVRISTLKYCFLDEAPANFGIKQYFVEVHDG